MATFYWTGAVNGGSGTWDTTSTNNWSATSGGAGGAGVPGVSDSVIFDAGSGAATCTLGSNVSALTLNMLSYAGTLDFSSSSISLAGTSGTVFSGGSGYTAVGSKNILLTGGGASVRTIAGGTPSSGNAINIAVLSGTGSVTFSGRHGAVNFLGFTGTLNTGSFNIYGDLTLDPSMTIAATANSIGLFDSGTTRTIITNGTVINRSLYLNAAGSTWLLGDNLTMGSGRQFLVFNGTLSIDGRILTVGNLMASYSTIREIDFGSGGTLNVLDAGGVAFNASTSTNLTVSGTGTISMNSASDKTFNGGGKNWPILNQGGSGRLSITGANSFSSIANSVQPTIITFPSGTVTTVESFNVSGTSGNLVVIDSSSPGVKATLSDSSGVNSVSFCDIKDTDATGGAFWRSYVSSGNVDSGNNSGWDFDETTFRYIYSRRKNKVVLPV